MEKFKKIWRLAVPTALVSLPVLALADVDLPAGTGLSLLGIQQIIETVANWLIIIGVFIAVIYIIWGGIQYMTARGDSAKATKAKDAIIHGVIGAAIVLGVGAILRTTAALVTRTFFGAGQ